MTRDRAQDGVMVDEIVISAARWLCIVFTGVAWAALFAATFVAFSFCTASFSHAGAPVTGFTIGLAFAGLGGGTLLWTGNRIATAWGWGDAA
jgi:hypothetical protein